jgi:hypothetical protein
MRVELNLPESVAEPRIWVKHQPVLAMALRRGSIETGLHRSEMRRHTYDTGEMSLVPRHLEKWFRNDDLHYLCIAISDTALTAASDGASGEVELHRTDNLVDTRLGALVEAVNTERIAEFPSGGLFLDSVEQALAVALVNGYAVRHRSMRTHRGGLGSARLRRIKEFVDAKMEDELTLHEMAQLANIASRMSRTQFSCASTYSNSAPSRVYQRRNWDHLLLERGIPIRLRNPSQNSKRKATCPVRLPAFSAVCCAFNTPNVLWLLIFVAGGA